MWLSDVTAADTAVDDTDVERELKLKLKVNYSHRRPKYCRLAALKIRRSQFSGE